MDHVGLLPPLKLLRTESASNAMENIKPRSVLRNLFPATMPLLAAVADSHGLLGSTMPCSVQSLKIASPIPQEKEILAVARSSLSS